MPDILQFTSHETGLHEDKCTNKVIFFLQMKQLYKSYKYSENSPVSMPIMLIQSMNKS